MDAVTERMLERARARQAKVDAMKDRSRPTETTLRENNRNKVTASTSVDITKGANNRNTVTIETTVTMKRVPSKGSLKNNRSFDKKVNEVVEDETTSFEEESETEEEVVTKENVSPRRSSGQANNQACGIRPNVKSQLKRLGQLYSDGDPNLSSPIHRTEENFTVDDKYKSTSATVTAPTWGVMPSAKPARTARLAALANAINQWEDDLSHPVIGARTTQKSPVVSKHSQFGGNSNKITSHNRFIKPATVTPLKKKSPEKTTSSTSSSSLSVKQTVKRNSISKSVKQNIPDKHQSPRDHDGQSTLTSSVTLKQSKRNSPSAKGVKQKTPEKLHPPSNLKQSKQKRNSPPKSVVWDKAILSSLEAQGFCRSESNKRLIYEYANQEEDEPVASSSMSTTESKSPEKGSQNNRFASPSHAGPTMGVKQLRSPRKTATTPTTGSVRDKAAQYEESTSPTKRATDPAELPLSERLALFEKNKGSAILPKAPFASSVPIKHEVRRAEPPKPVVYEPSKPSTSSNFICQRPANKPTPSYHHDNKHTQQGVSRGLTSRLAMFEKPSSEKDHMKNILMEREKEMQMLKNRWNRKIEDPEPSQSYSPVPPPPPLPPSPPKYEPRRSGFYYESEEEEEDDEPPVTSPKVLQVDVEHSTLPEKSYPGLSIKPVKISPPKPGRLYPCLSDMDTESEVPESDDYRPGNDRKIYEEEDSDDSSNSFGQKIKEVAERHSRSNLKRDWYNNSDQSETEVMNEIDDFLEEALGADSSGDEATPPKRSMRSPKYGSQASHSFEYSKGYGTTTDDEQTNTDTEQKPLLHTVSFYRKQQTLSMKPTTPSKQVQIDPSSYNTDEDSLNDTKELERELEMIDEKIQQLQQEVTKQSIVIQQASQALNLCYSTIEFSGSTEQVEAEKHLLVATIKRQAALHEIQRLKIECSLRPQGPNNKMLTERGSVTLSRITLPLKLDIIRSAARDEQCYYLVCLIRCGEKVLATNMMSTLPRSLRENNKLTFPNVLTLDNLYSDFKITVEVYAMTARSKEVIPHDIKYHIGNTKKEASKLKLTPKKNKGDSRLVMPVVQSPGGPNVVRTSAFNMVGYVIFSLREIQRTQFTLNKVAYTSVLEGSLHLKLDCEMSVDVVHRGFLTMFEDISGFGAWHRRWCLLNGDQLSYWKYPDDERKKIAIDTIELSACTTDVIGPVTRDLCARPNTFLLETARPVRSTDVESLVLMREGDRTINRHLLSADTKEERAEWCAQLNKALALMRAWGKKMPTN